ncbi:serine threonine- kinase TOR [Olea europaea subsp. europaea]|uniref:Serine threonine- kinase TOR n=1 Tax=Olea europaea subsp. europaea TaxID=158383 RepID=A0A8S0PED8_OLEEU|nr:serine threonine- kinase TOR [Olea europaea subsp. europaea]
MARALSNRFCVYIYTCTSIQSWHWLQRCSHLGLSYAYDEAALALRRHIEEHARDLSDEAFSRFMDQLYDIIASLLERNEVTENMSALWVIDELLDFKVGENALKVAKIVNYMQTSIEAKREPEILVLASAVQGHLARAIGTMTAVEVECLVC